MNPSNQIKNAHGLAFLATSYDLAPALSPLLFVATCLLLFLTTNVSADSQAQSCTVEFDGFDVDPSGSCASGSCPASVASTSFGTTTATDGSVELQVSLGRRAFGKSAGFLSIKEFAPTNLLGTPRLLRYRFPTHSDCELITNS